MKKKVVSFLLALSMIVMSTFASFAGTKNNIEFKDLKRLQEVMTQVSGQKCTIINYQMINGGEWMIRVVGADTPQEYSKYSGDYRVRFVEAQPDITQRPAACWFYAGVFDNTWRHTLQGFAVAVREYRKQFNQYYTFSQPDNYAIPELQ